MEMEEEITKALRELVAAIYNDCYGAYGTDTYPYEGQYENLIRACASAIMKAAQHSV